MNGPQQVELGPDKYVIFLFVDGIRSASKRACSSLMEAYDAALALQESDDRQNAEYRIRGRGPSAAVAAKLGLEGGSPFGAPLTWYVLDSSHAKPHAIKASRVPRAMGCHPRPSSRRLPAKQIFQHRDAAKSQTQPDSRDKQQAPLGTAYRVVSVNRGKKQTLPGTYRSLDEACKHAKNLEKTQPLVHGRYFVEYHLPSSHGGILRQHTTVKSVSRRVEADKRTSKNSKSRSSRGPHDWEVENRKELPHWVHSADEIGLGIPAQWGKGRRNRRGDYIP